MLVLNWSFTLFIKLYLTDRQTDRERERERETVCVCVGPL